MGSDRPCTCQQSGPVSPEGKTGGNTLNSKGRIEDRPTKGCVKGSRGLGGWLSGVWRHPVVGMRNHSLVPSER